MQKAKNILSFLVLVATIAYSLWRFPNQHVFYGIITFLYLAVTLDKILTKHLPTTFFIQLAVTFVFLDLTFQKVEWPYLLSFWHDINHWRWIPFIVINVILSLIIRSFKWKYLFNRHVPMKDLSTATFIGFMTLSIFPARIGEFIRGFILADRQKLKKSHVLTTIFLERIFDGFGIFTLMIAVMVMGPTAKEKFLPFIIITCIAYVMLLLIVVIFYFFTPSIKKATLSLLKKTKPSWTTQATDIIHKIHDGLHLFTDAKKMITFLLLTILLWWVNMFTTYMLLRSVDFIPLFQIDLASPGTTYLYASLLMLVLICFAIAIPSGPGGAGPYQYIVQFTVILLNPAVSHDPLLLSKVGGLSIYLWIVQNIVVIAAGSWFYFRNHYSIKQLNQIKSQDV